MKKRTLQEQIDARRKEIQTDGYSMSIGEIIRLYEDGELDVHPEFQRIFRWTLLQKSKLIESILLGIPLPSIFVAQREDGVWDVVDGLQRLSTILEFVGSLKDENKERLSPSKLLATPYLPELAGKIWDGENPEESFSSAQRISFKREKIDLKIIKKESDVTAKYELFQRLNTLGSALSAQEVRNCLLIMINKPFYEWLLSLASYPAFIVSTELSEKQDDQRYDLELVLRYLVFRSGEARLTSQSDFHEALTAAMILLAEQATTSYLRTAEAEFKKTFDILNEALGGDAFRRYDPEKDKFLGGFSVAAFEAIAIGLGQNASKWSQPLTAARKNTLVRKIKELWSNTIFSKNSGGGIRSSLRIKSLLGLGRSVFK